MIGTHDGVILPHSDVAEEIAPLIADGVTVYSEDHAWPSKLHLHDDATGAILTQINYGSIRDWDRLLDLRDMEVPD